MQPKTVGMLFNFYTLRLTHNEHRRFHEKWTHRLYIPYMHRQPYSYRRWVHFIYISLPITAMNLREHFALTQNEHAIIRAKWTHRRYILYMYMYPRWGALHTHTRRTHNEWNMDPPSIYCVSVPSHLISSTVGFLHFTVLYFTLLYCTLLYVTLLYLTLLDSPLL